MKLLEMAMRMMDTNKWLVEPEGYLLAVLEPEGAYLHVVYTQAVFGSGTLDVLGRNEINVYLNDQGREVLRTHKFVPNPPSTQPEPVRLPVGRWYRFKNGCLIALQGLEEILKCLKQ